MATSLTEAIKRLSVTTSELIDLFDSFDRYATLMGRFTVTLRGEVLEPPLCEYHRSPISNTKLRSLLFGMDAWVEEEITIAGVRTGILFYREKIDTIEIDDDLVEEISCKLGNGDSIETDKPLTKPHYYLWDSISEFIPYQAAYLWCEFEPPTTYFPKKHQLLYTVSVNFLVVEVYLLR